MVEGAPAIVDAGREVVVAADGEARQGDVGGGDAKLLFAASAKAFDNGPAELDGEWRLRGRGAGNGVAGSVGTWHGLWSRVGKLGSVCGRGKVRCNDNGGTREKMPRVLLRAATTKSDLT